MPRILITFLGSVTEEEARQRLPSEVQVLKVFPDLGQVLAEVPEGFSLDEVRGQSGVVGAEEEQEFQLFNTDNEDTEAEAGQEPTVKPTEFIPGFQLSSEVQPSKAFQLQGLSDVLNDIGARNVWQKTQGEGSVVAIIDSGVCGQFFPEEKRAGGIDASEGTDPWSDPVGHGSMTATIAAGDSDTGNPMDGVAPKAEVFSAKIFNRDGSTSTSRIMEAIQGTIDFARNSEKPVVANNSWGNVGCSPPTSCGGFSVSNAYRTLTRSGAPVTFAAGNEAEKCDKQGCGETTIWLQNSVDEVLSVATVDSNGEVRSYSSRGPGQCSTVNKKPDIAAPTYGSTVWKCGTRDFDRGWGTSGAAPAIAGVLALMKSVNPDMSTQQLHDAVRSSGNESWDGCKGHGVVDAPAAMAESGSPTVSGDPATAALPVVGALGLGLLITGVEEPPV